jgi:hypothetical protein
LCPIRHDSSRFSTTGRCLRGIRKRWRHSLGADHPDTLDSAINLAAALHGLGERQAARRLDEDTLTRRRRVLGDDHPDTLRSANGLAADLHALGEFDVARTMDEDTLSRYRRVLGDDHPETLRTAESLQRIRRQQVQAPRDRGRRVHDGEVDAVAADAVLRDDSRRM